LKVEVGGELGFESASSALRREVLESGREHRHCIRDGFEEALMPALKGDCAKRRFAVLLITYSDLDVVGVLGPDSFSNLVSNSEVAASLPFSAVKKFRIGDQLAEFNLNFPSPSTTAHLLST
jgi:hypothetical protein